MLSKNGLEIIRKRTFVMVINVTISSSLSSACGGKGGAAY